MKSDIARLHKIGTTVARHGFGHQLAQVRLFERLGFVQQPLVDSSIPMSSRFALMLEELGPTFVKLGQILSTRPDLLPPHFVAELSRLQDRVPPLPFAEIRQALSDSLVGPLEDHFSFVAEEPIASASIAQVHAAKLSDGTPVVVKVQRPGISSQMATDSELIRKVAQVFELLFDEIGTYGPVAIVEEWQKGLSLELDFENEGRAIGAFYRANANRPRVRVPRFYPEHSSRTVLTMERLMGRKLVDVENQDERQNVARDLVQSAFEQVFEDGLFHADPHPGNFLVLDTGEIGIIDFGLVGRLSKNSQDSLIALALAIALNDADTAARLIYRIGSPVDRIPLARFRSEVHAMLDRYLGLSLEQVHTRVLAREILDLMAQYKMRIPREFALLAKATVTLEGVIRDIYPDLDIQATLLPYAERMLIERYDPRQLKGGGLRLLLQLGGFVQDLPLQISQALLDFESGKTTIRAEGGALTEIAAALRSVGVAILAGSVTLGSMIAAVLSLSRSDLLIFGVPAGLVVGFMIAIVAVVSGSAYVLAGGRLPRLRLKRRAGHRDS